MFNPWQDLGAVQSELMQAAARQGPGDPHGCMMIGSGAGVRGRGQGCRLRTEMIGSLTNGLPVPMPRSLLSPLVVGETWISSDSIPTSHFPQVWAKSNGIGEAAHCPGQNSRWKRSLGQGGCCSLLLPFHPGAPLVTQLYGAAYLRPQLQGEPLSPC